MAPNCATPSSAQCEDSEGPTVCVIGCGPGGMFFLHALEGKRQEFLKTRNEEALRRFPVVSCFERSDAPGGVWRAKRSHGGNTTDNKYQQRHIKQPHLSTCFEHIQEEKKSSEDDFTVLAGSRDCSGDLKNSKPEDTTNMYEALWSNGPNMFLEFADYTYDEHFGHALPVYLPRHEILEYLIKRCLKRNPAIFDTVNFNTSVQHVEYDNDLQKFRVTIQKHQHSAFGGDITHVRLFDKCVWAGGDNGKVSLPTGLMRTLRSEGFQGPMVHSSDTTNFEENVRGKRVLLVGGGFSGEDIALVCCKTGAEKVYITSRREDSEASWTKTWPGKRVEVLSESRPIGANGPNSIEIQFVVNEGFDSYSPYTAWPNRSIDVDTVIFCTGYKSNTKMLAPNLENVFEKLEDTISIPQDWKPASNEFDDILGGPVPPGEVRWIYTRQFYADLYQFCLIDNPNMMYCYGDDTYAPLFGVDIVSHHLVNLVTGQTTLPSKEKMRCELKERALWELANYPFLRYQADKNYFKAMNKAYKPEHDELWNEVENDLYEYDLLILGELQELANYPGPTFIGTPKTGFTAKGKEMLEHHLKTIDHRWPPEDLDDETIKWKTYRDVENCHEFKSFITGTVSVPLKKRWMDISDVYDKDIVRPDVMKHDKASSVGTENGLMKSDVVVVQETQ